MGKRLFERANRTPVFQLFATVLFLIFIISCTPYAPIENQASIENSSRSSLQPDPTPTSTPTNTPSDGVASLNVSSMSTVAGTSAQVNVSNGPGNTTDWVGLYKSGS